MTDEILAHSSANYTPPFVQIEVRSSESRPDTLYGLCKDGVVWIRAVVPGSCWTTLDEYLWVNQQ